MADVLILFLILVGIVTALSFSAMMIAVAFMVADEMGFIDWIKEMKEKHDNQT